MSDGERGALWCGVCMGVAFMGLMNLARGCISHGTCEAACAPQQCVEDGQTANVCADPDGGLVARRVER